MFAPHAACRLRDEEEEKAVAAFAKFERTGNKEISPVEMWDILHEMTGSEPSKYPLACLFGISTAESNRREGGMGISSAGLGISTAGGLSTPRSHHPPPKRKGFGAGKKVGGAVSNGCSPGSLDFGLLRPRAACTVRSVRRKSSRILRQICAQSAPNIPEICLKSARNLMR